MRILTLLIIPLGVLGGLDSATAQDAQPAHLTTSVGVFQYQLSRSGLAPMVAMRATVPVSSVLILEGGVVAARPQHQVGGSTTFLAPEAQIQLALPFDRFVPYMGLGGGAVFDLAGSELGGAQADFSVSGSVGFRTWFRERAGLQVEFRGRGIGMDFEQTSSEYTAGMIWRI